jgi:hypothetical protein
MRAVAIATSLVLAALFGMLVASSACFVIVGGTGGYHLPDAGTCMSAGDCADGQVCCFSPSASLAAEAPAGACQSSCSGPQLCAKSEECGDAGSCLMQQCDAGAGIGVATVQACGAVCSAMPSSGD